MNEAIKEADRDPGIELRHMTENDAAEYFNLIDKNRLYFSRFRNMTPDAYRNAANVREALARPGDKVLWGIYAHTKLVGAITLEPTKRMHQTAGIGYVVGEEFSNRGYATAAIKKVIDDMKNQYKSFIAVTDSSNIASRKVLEKAGFRFWSENKHGDSIFHYSVKEYNE